MTHLLKAWLLDPLALLFLLSLLLGTGLIVRCRFKSRQLPATTAERRPVNTGLQGSMAMLLWIAVFLLCSAPVIVNPLIAQLEDPYLNRNNCVIGSHMIVLGGGVDSRVAEAEDFGRMSSATLTRATEAASRLLAAPGTRVIVAGGAVGRVAEAEVIGAYLQRLGVGADRIVKDADSASTRQNALNVARLLEQESISGSVGLVTSAMHMPRALLSFRQVLSASDIRICPVSVDVQALKDVPWYALMPQTTAIMRFEMLLHEAVALLIYRLRGWL